MKRALAFTVLLSRSCLNVLCGEDETCFQGQCVDARCTQESPEFCGGVLCEQDSDCGNVSECASARCDAGACWFEALSSMEENACDSETEWCHPEVGCIDRGESFIPPEVEETDPGSDPPTIYYRDDMEGGLLGSANSVDINGGELRMVNDPVRSGVASLEAIVEGAGVNANLEKNFDSPIAEGLLYARVHAYLDSNSSFVDSLIMLRIDGIFSASDQDKISLNIGQERNIKYSSNASSEHLSSIGGAMPEDQWTCLELIIDLHETNGSISVRKDGEEILSGIGGMDTVPDGGVGVLDYGIPFLISNGQPANARLLLDDLVVANYEVGCEG